MPWICSDMKRIGKEPRLLPSVMEAIANLKEKHGSTPRQIVDHISHVMRRNKDTSRNVTVQVRRALEHGLHCGLIKQRGGKYTLGLDRKDYAIFRRFRQVNDPLSDCNTCRRGRRKRGGRRGKRRRSRRRGRRGRRRRTLSNEDAMSTDETESGRSINEDTPEPVDIISHRRRRRKKGRGRRGRRRRRHGTTNEVHSDSSIRKESNSAIPPEKRRSDQDKVDYQPKTASNHNHHQERHPERNHAERNHSQEEEDADECGNPECLCNIKQEEDSPRCLSRENTYYNDSYLN